jgi:3-methyl-2-oxobutanoate hydroxymethyltransferase
MRLTLKDFQKMRAEGSKIAMLSCYDASFAALAETAGVEIFLIGDSLGMVIQGHDSPLPVTLADVEYHTRAVVRGSRRALVVADLPFGTYQESPQQALRSAAKLMAAGANMVKLEGGRVMFETVSFLVQRGIPVMGHLGLTPQSFNQLGGFRVQGKTDSGARELLEDAKALQDAGAAMLVLEAIPAQLGKQVTESLSIATIGIGAGAQCSGQVLILYDMLDVFPGNKAKFVRNFMIGAPSIRGALENFVKAVKDQSFPAPEHTY